MTARCQGCERTCIVETCHQVPSHGFCTSCRRYMTRVVNKIGYETPAEFFERTRNLNAKMEEMRMRRGMPIMLGVGVLASLDSTEQNPNGLVERP